MNFVQRVGVAATTGALLVGATTGPAHAEDLEPPGDTAPLVGMAFAGATDTLWLAGTQADAGVVTAADDGRTVTFAGSPVSVQALAWKDDRLWIADIGDAEASRDLVVVYRLNSVAESTSSFNAFDFIYEDGPRDAKAMMISGRGRIHIVTAGDDPGIYRAPLDPSRQELNTLERVAEAPAGVTDGTFLADGTTMVLRSATGLEYIDALTWEPMYVDTLLGAPDGESVAANGDDVLYVGGNPTIRVAQVASADATTTVGPPTDDPSSPDTSVSPSTSASAGATNSSTGATTTSTASADVSDPSATGSPGRTGTLIALIAAALVALTAGAVVAIRRT